MIDYYCITAEKQRRLLERNKTVMKDVSIMCVYNKVKARSVPIHQQLQGGKIEFVAVVNVN